MAPSGYSEGVIEVLQEDHTSTVGFRYEGRLDQGSESNKASFVQGEQLLLREE